MNPIIYRHDMSRAYAAIAAGSGYSIDDKVVKCLSADSGAGATRCGPPVWVNLTTGKVIKPAPILSDLSII